MDIAHFVAVAILSVAVIINSLGIKKLRKRIKDLERNRP